MSDREHPPGLSEERRAALLQAAMQIFARYGYRKASMDEVARAVGLSRQGLYLHYPSKEVLFRAVVTFMLESSLSAAQTALADTARSVGERLVHAFDSMYGQYVENFSATPHLPELFETAAGLLGSLITEQECAFRDAVAGLLERSGRARLWSKSGLSAQDLTETLEAAAYGLKHRSSSRAEFLTRFRKVVQLVCRT